MRLRLHILRNELPALKMIWETTSTLKPGVDDIVSNLLACINTIVPLDSSTWGLEDYVVELGGFEVLHFQEISAVFKEDDEVVVRPLSTSETRQRRLSGRTQICTNGRKLVDGTPFGRPYIRPAPDRPPVLIPSTKRSKSGHGIETSTLQLQDGREWSDDYSDDYESKGAANNEALAFNDAFPGNAVVRFAPSESHSDESDDSSFRASNSESRSESDSDSDSDSDTGSEDPSEGHSSEGPSRMASGAHLAPSLPNEAPSSPTASTKETPESLIKQSGNGKISDSEMPEVRSSKRMKIDNSQGALPADKDANPPSKGPGTASGTLPYQASSATVARNMRKKKSNTMKRLQAQGILEQSCTLKRFNDILTLNGLSTASPNMIKEFLVKMNVAQSSSNSAVKAINTGKGAAEPSNNEAEKEVESRTEERPLEKETSKEAPEKKAKVDIIQVKKSDRKRYKIAIQEGRAKPGNIRQWIRETALQEAQGLNIAQPPEVNESRDILQPTAQQSKTDVRKFQNLKLNSYGKSNKKWKQMRSKPATRTTYDEDGNPVLTDVPIDDVPPAAEENEETNEASDPDAWGLKIHLSAVECEQKNVALPIPNFPFKQQQLFQNDTTMNPGKKRKRAGKPQRTHVDEVEGYQKFESIQISDHNDQSFAQTNKPSSYQNASTMNDLPMLPDDISSLYPLTQPLLRGTIIAFKQLSMGERYEPIITDYRTAIVEKVFPNVQNGPRVELRLAIRDRPEVHYDEETGEKVLGKFDMPGFEKEEESGFLDLMWGEMLEAKVVKLPKGGIEQEEQEEQLEQEPEERELRRPGKAQRLKGYNNGDAAEELDYGDDIHQGQSHNTPSKELDDVTNDRAISMNNAPIQLEEQEREDEEIDYSLEEVGHEENSQLSVPEDLLVRDTSIEDEIDIQQNQHQRDYIRRSEENPEIEGSQQGDDPMENEEPNSPSLGHTTSGIPEIDIPLAYADIETGADDELSPCLGSLPASVHSDQAEAAKQANTSSPLPGPEDTSDNAVLRSGFDYLSYSSDSDLPPALTILSQASEPRSTQVKDEPGNNSTVSSSLPPLPDFSPFSMAEKRRRTLETDEVDQSQQQIQAEAASARPSPKSRRSTEPVEVIDLMSSSPEQAAPPLRSKPVNTSAWKAVRGLRKR